MSDAAILESFNKTIKIELQGKNGKLKNAIVCPTSGRKPDIVVSGAMYACDIVNSLEIRIKGLYFDNLYEYNEIKIYMGYNFNYTRPITATIVNAYISKPAPERETIFECMPGTFEKWSNSKCDVNFKAGTSLKAAMQTLTGTLENFKEVQVSTSVVSETFSEQFQFQGYTKDAFHAIKNLFPNVMFLVLDNQFVLVGKNESSGSVKKLTKLKTPPQYNGANIMVQTLYNQNLAPGDVFSIDSTYFLKTAKLMKADRVQGKFKIYAIKFEFATVQDINAMSIQANSINADITKETVK